MITLIIIAITVIASVYAMNDEVLKRRFSFYPYAISRNGEWWRFFTDGLLHIHFPHLFFNMYALYLFGTNVENIFTSDAMFGRIGGEALYVLLYVGAFFFSSIHSYFNERNNPSYSAMGASGAISAVIFAMILIDPLMKMGLMFIPVYFPAWIFGPVYLFLERLLVKRNVINFESNVHIWGSVYGFILPILFKPVLIQIFIWQLKAFFLYGGVPQ